MQKHSDALLTSAGNAVPGASVVVTKQDDTAATLYSDNGTTPISSTLTSDPSGEYSFYAPNGRYKKVVSGTGLTTETVSDILVYDPNDGDVAHAEFYATLQAALDTGRKVRLTRGTTYTVSTTLSVPSGGGLIAEWDATLTLASGVNNHVIRIADGASDVEIRGVIINGSKATNTGGHGIAVGSGGGNKIRIRNNYVYNCSGNGIYVSGSTYGIHVTGNYATGNTLGGIGGDDTTNKFAFDWNFAWLNGTYGVGLIGIGTHGSISHNVAWDNGQGTPNADNITAYNIGNDNLTVIGNTTHGGLNNGIHLAGQRCRVIGNSAYGATQYGVAFHAASGNCEDLVFEGNHGHDCGLAGLWIRNVVDGTVSGNQARSNGTDGMVIDGCTDLSISDNGLVANTGCGIRNAGASSHLSFGRNRCRANGSHGIDLTDVTWSRVDGGNIIRSNTGRGVNFGGTENNNHVCNNTIRQNTAGQIGTPNITTRVHDNMTGTSTTVASAATLTLPVNDGFFYVTGTTGITSITASYVGRTITLEFDDALTITDGSNLRMAGNFTTTFMDSITFRSDGTNWIEMSRSVN